MNLSFYYSTKDFLNLTPYILLDSIVRPSYGILNFYFAMLFILLFVDNNFISLCSCECGLWISESSLLESVLSFHHVGMRLKSGCKACQQVLYLVSKLNAPGCVWWGCGCVIVWCPSYLPDYMKRNLFCCCCSIWLIFRTPGRKLNGMYPMKDMKLPHSYFCTMSHFPDWILQWFYSHV